MMKKLVTMILAALLATSMVAGCSSDPQTASSAGDGKDTESKDSVSSAKPEPKKISFAHVQGEWSWGSIDGLVADYKEKSGNDVEVIYVPAGDITTWSQTQFAGGVEPDIIWSADQPASEYYKNGWTVDLKPYFEANSNYTGKPWKDNFIDGVLNGVIDSNMGEAMVGMPVSCSTVQMYYNKDIFNEVGLPDKAPETWSEVIDYCKTVKDSGKDYVPYSIQNSISWNLGWQENFIMEQLWFDVVDKLDILTANGKIDMSEAALGIKTGVVDLEDQRMVDYYSFLKDMVPYFNTGFNVASWEYEQLFNEGKAAMNLNGGWFPNQYISNELSVNYGIGAIPYVDSKISEKAENKKRLYAIGLGGPDFVVTKKAEKEGRLDAAIDFMQYCSDPTTGAKFIAEKFMFVPVVKDVEVPEVMKPIMESIGTDMQTVNWNATFLNFTPEMNAEYLVLRQTFLEDDSTPEEMATKVKALISEYCDQAIAEHPEWKVEENLDKVSK